MSVMSWSPSARRNAIAAAARMLGRQEWRESEHGAELTRIVRRALTCEDRVDRLHAAYAIRLLDPSPNATLALVRARLLVESEPHVAGALANELAALASGAPHAVDAVLGELAASELWQARLYPEDAATTGLEPLLSLALWLAIGRDMPHAKQLVRDWCADPVSRPGTRQLFWLMRPWLALPPSRANERGRAFELLRATARALGGRRAATNIAEAVDLYSVASVIVDQLYFASGAFGENGSDDRTPVPAQDGFAAEAFSAIELLTEFREPTIVHHIVETMAHLAPADPRTAFLLVERSISTGDAYTFDSMAANATVALVARYLADFREVVATDVEVLDAIRRVLHAFVRVGWPAAVALSYRLGEAFR